jgi:hypothetical protein
MADLGTIAAALSSLKTAADIAKFLRETNLSIEHAELKLKLAELVGALAQAKIELVGIQEELSEKNKRIAEIEEAFQSKDTIVRHGDAYYVTDGGGKPIGIPYCLRCMENDHKKRQLVHDANNYRMRVCTTCGHRYDGNAVIEIRKP